MPAFSRALGSRVLEISWPLSIPLATINLLNARSATQKECLPMACYWVYWYR